MTLAQLAAFVTMKVGQTDDESVAACKDFLKARYRMVWEAGLWADSQALVSVSGATGDAGLIEFTDDVARVLNLRNTGTSQDVLGSSIGTIFNFDSSIFTETGTEQKFVHVKAGPVPFARGVGAIMFKGSTVLGGSTPTLTITGGNGRGGILTEQVVVPLNATSEATTIDFTGKVGSNLDNSGQGRYFVAYSTASTSVAVSFLISGSFTPGAGADVVIGVNINSTDNAAALAAACASSADLNQYFYVAVNGNTVTLTAFGTGQITDTVDGNTGLPLTITQGGYGEDANSSTEFDELYFIESDISQSGIPFQNEAGDALGTFSGSIFPAGASTTFTNVQRVRVYPTPSASQTYLAHVKLKQADLDEDSDEPALAGIENVLLAFAQADMLERQRQYAKAQAKIKEAQMLMDEMLDLERNQQAYEARIIPDQSSALGNQWGTASGEFGASGKGYW